MKRNGCFAESDTFRDQYYGSSIDRVKRVLADSHGILALTPRGAAAVYKLRHEINLKFVVLKAGEELLRKNLFRRGVTDTQKQNQVIEEHGRFELPTEIPNQRFFLTGGEEDKKLLAYLETII